MSKMPEDMNMVRRYILCKLCKQMWDLLTTPKDVVWRMLYFGPRNSISCEAERRV
jgi:hypothetical protein